MTASPTLGPGPHRTTLLRAFVVLVPLFLCIPSCFGKEWSFHLVGDLAIQSTSISAGLLPCLSIPLSSLPCNSGISAHLAWPIDFSMISGNIPVAISHHLLRLCQDAESRISKPLPHQYSLPMKAFVQDSCSNIPQNPVLCILLPVHVIWILKLFIRPRSFQPWHNSNYDLMTRKGGASLTREQLCILFRRESLLLIGRSGQLCRTSLQGNVGIHQPRRPTTTCQGRILSQPES